MQMPVVHRVMDQTLWLSGERALFWEEQKALVLSDLHFGKTGHFRKAGIAVPQSVYRSDLQRLLTLVQHFKPQQLIIVGDMFHSSENREMEWFSRWRQQIDARVVLVKGNHDILENRWYQENHIEVHERYYDLACFRFTHDAADTGAPATGTYVFSGHVHPGVQLNGPGKQHLRFPCFYFCDHYAVLPAFSHFTGLAMVKPCRSDNVYAIVPPAKHSFSGATVLKIGVQ